MADLLSTEEAAALLHLNVKRVQALARRGELPAVRQGRKWLFPRERLLRSLKGSGAAPKRTPTAGPGLDISARNQLRGRVSRIVVDGLMAEVEIRIGDQQLTAVITRSSAERLGLAEGDDVAALVKATEVMVAKPAQPLARKTK